MAKPDQRRSYLATLVSGGGHRARLLPAGWIT